MNPSPPANAGPLQFEGFEIWPAQRLLRVAHQPAAIGARAFDLLMALVDHADRTVSKQELLDLVWPQMVVEENNLQVHVHALRKLLGPQAITTVPGRGYRFTAAPLVQIKASGNHTALPSLPEPAPGPPEASGPGHDAPPALGNLPSSAPPLIGREDDLATLKGLLMGHRLVTISGAGGIGKTCLALHLAMATRRQWPDGAWLVELAGLQDEALLPSLVAQVLQVPLPDRGEALPALRDSLRNRRLLLVLDNCEHLIGAASALVGQLMLHAPGVRLLVTSQELMRVPGEHVYKLPSLAVPQHQRPLSLAQAMQFGAVALLVDRVRARDRRFVLDQHNCDAVVEICRRLDGIPLALELAAARVAVLGPMGVRDRLDERFQMLTAGARVAMPRHQTLRAALDWSHQLLSPEACRVLRRVALFSDGFGVDTAQALASDAEIDRWQVLDLLSLLIEKSLVQVEDGPPMRFRLLESTRAYGLEKLAEAGETQRWLRRFANVIADICEQAVRQRDTERIWAELGNLRSAFAWAIGTNGDALIALSLATHSAMVLAVAGQVSEALDRLLQVEPRITEDMPPALVAQFWQWLGRGGVDGRLATSRCLAALHKAEAMFRELNNPRHLHGCLRMRAEALLAAANLSAAGLALQEAEAMEVPGWPVADRLRRLRVHGLLDAAEGRPDVALQRLRHAYDMAQAANIARYVSVLLGDMADVLLQAGRAEEAQAHYLSLAELSRRARHDGLTLAQALAGQVAALLSLDRPAQAIRVAAQALPALERSGLFMGASPVLAWLLAHAQQHRAAGLLLGASDAHQANRETVGSAPNLKARAATLHMLLQACGQTQLNQWLTEGARLPEGLLQDLVHPCLVPDEAAESR